jgi:sterol desaturase/sphingolipid hydroxylase (fatty acid hydroxylase superfamily)
MNEFRELLLIKISLPIYILVIGFEFFYSHFKNKGLYTGKGTLANAYLTLSNMALDVLVRGVCLYILYFFYQYKFVSLAAWPVLYWFTLFIAEDFMYYWLHRVDHYCRFFWAVHVTHHNSEEFNLTVGFRSSVFQPLYRFIYFIPLALFGFDAMDIMFAYAATQIYGILVHTQTVNKLGFLESIFVTPSHHRVHHGSNIMYLDKNMGMFLIIWDKLFGTFQAEDENVPVKYGLTKNIESNNPFTVIFHEWKSILKDLRKQTSLKNKFMYVFGPPGWSHDGSTKTSNQLRAEWQAKENK